METQAKLSFKPLNPNNYLIGYHSMVVFHLAGKSTYTSIGSNKNA
jgi:hypothetical protein